MVGFAQVAARNRSGSGEGGIIWVATATGDIWQCGRSQFCIVVVFVFGGGAVLYIPKREGRAGEGSGGGDVFPLQAYN